jgi:hypothetical protein
MHARKKVAGKVLPLRCYLAAIAIFINEVKGKSALALSRDLCVSYKCAFVLLHKLREAMADELKGRMIGGEGKEAEADGGYFGLCEARQPQDGSHRPSLCPEPKTASARLL